MSINCTHYEYGNKAGGYDDPVTLTVVSSFSNENTVEYEVPKSQLETTSCRENTAVILFSSFHPCLYGSSAIRDSYFDPRGGGAKSCAMLTSYIR